MKNDEDKIVGILREVFETKKGYRFFKMRNRYSPPHLKRRIQRAIDDFMEVYNSSSI